MTTDAELADEIEREGIERVIYGLGHAAQVQLNRQLVTALRSLAGDARDAELVQAARQAQDFVMHMVNMPLGDRIARRKDVLKALDAALRRHP